jgi:hypothetical protein
VRALNALGLVTLLAASPKPVRVLSLRRDEGAVPAEVLVEPDVPESPLAAELAQATAARDTVGPIEGADPRAGLLVPALAMQCAVESPLVRAVVASGHLAPEWLRGVSEAVGVCRLAAPAPSELPTEDMRRANEARTP